MCKLQITIVFLNNLAVISTMDHLIYDVSKYAHHSFKELKVMSAFIQRKVIKPGDIQLTLTGELEPANVWQF